MNESFAARLRERLEQAGCYRESRDPAGETWFTPHRNRRFRIPPVVHTAAEANAVLREAGMEEAY
ncbi:MAG: hypothetical protein ACM30I_06500 [Gemmatimonas sp.]